MLVYQSYVYEKNITLNINIFFFSQGSNFPEHSFGLGRTISVCMLCFILCGLCVILVKYHCKLQPQTKKTKGKYLKNATGISFFQKMFNSVSLYTR